MRIQRKNKGFTLLEIILVIAAIGILASIVLVAINPNRQLAQARNLVRQTDINTIQKALEQYLIDNKAYPSSISTTPGYICNTEKETSPGSIVCGSNIDLRVLVPTYLASIPKDPQATGTNTGYNVVINPDNNRVSITSSLAENKSIVSNSFIVKDGLVLHLDAGNTASYPGTGTTWTDLSGNGNTGTLVNGVGYNSDNGGKLVFDGVNDYVSIPVDLRNTTYTIIATARYTGSINQRIITSNTGNWLMGWWGNQTNAYHAESWVSSGGGTPETSWITYAALGNYLADTWSLYRNGNLIVGQNSNGVNGPNGIRIGGWQVNEFSTSEVSYILAYNRALTPEEIQQNFNTTRGRFGL